jgi:hypothetical protein
VDSGVRGGACEKKGEVWKKSNHEIGFILEVDASLILLIKKAIQEPRRHIGSKRLNHDLSAIRKVSMQRMTIYKLE